MILQLLVLKKFIRYIHLCNPKMPVLDATFQIYHESAALVNNYKISTFEYFGTMSFMNESTNV